MGEVKLTVNEILDAARAYKQTTTSSPTYRDYEYFKDKLHQNGHYGKERILADILKV